MVPVRRAAIGVASVSYVGVQSGCAPDSDVSEDGPSKSAAPGEDDNVTPDVAENALTISATQAEALRRPLSTSGNLVPPAQINLSKEVLAASQQVLTVAGALIATTNAAQPPNT